MKPLKKGTPVFGIILGLVFAALGVLVMVIGFWKTLVLAVLFCIGYFLGAVENKNSFVRQTANKLIPEKTTKTIDLKNEILQEQMTRMESIENVSKTRSGKE